MSSEKQTIEIMQKTVKPIVELIEQRLETRQAVINTLSANAIDTSVPESVKLLREQEAARVRAVVQELKDLLAMIKALHPNTNA